MQDQQWIWQQNDWPHFYWQELTIQPLLRAVRFKQGVLLGKTGVTTEDLPLASVLDTLLDNITASSAIEGEQLNVQSLRSSLAKKIGLHRKHLHPTTEQSEGLAHMMWDILSNREMSLSLERLCQWHQWLFCDPSTLYPIVGGVLRDDEPMQVVSGRIDKPTVHFEAPPRDKLEKELARFITWFNDSLMNPALDPLLRAAITHFWFVTIHPFEDGNGRITRALTDLALIQADRLSIRLYAMSMSILANRQAYYQILERSQRDRLDITPWLIWFLGILEKSVQNAIDKIDHTLAKLHFWQKYQGVVFNQEQTKIVNLLMDEPARFAEGISASQYQKITKVSKATATRHLTDLFEKGCIEKSTEGGRSTRYHLT